MEQHGSFMPPSDFVAANMELFIRDLYKSRIEKLCDLNMEGTHQFRHAKLKYAHWKSISDNMAHMHNEDRQPPKLERQHGTSGVLEVSNVQEPDHDQKKPKRVGNKFQPECSNTSYTEKSNC